MKISPFHALFPIVLTIAAFPATAQPNSPDPTAPPLITPDTRAYRYQCIGERTFEAEYSLELATVTMEGETFRLTQTPSASGARYTDGTMTLYTKGNEAFLEMNGQMTYEDCLGEPIALSEQEGESEIVQSEAQDTVSDEESAVVEPIIQPITFVCDDDMTFQAEFTPEQAELTLEDATLILEQIPAASGAQYSDGQTLLATRGDAAFIEVDGEMLYENCLAQTDAAEAEESSVERSAQTVETVETVETTQQTTQQTLQQTTVQQAPAPAMSSPVTSPAPSPTPVRALW
ncbi:hypothetical protein C7B61_16065 [filamentous cyanobacterium CCP1]|nr:hypothetical protein C7B61_16065 [filamentous cyanobacterium CCP1]